MSNILLVLSSPRGGASYSTRVAQALVEKLQGENPGAKVVVRDLVKAPLPLIDYVILHEVAHIKHHDHGRGFERLMNTHLPNWRECRRDLNTLGATILID